MKVQRVVGGVEPPVVEFQIADKSSAMAAFLQYARASKLNWRIRRAGFVVDTPGVGNAIVGTTIEVRRPRTSISRLPQVYSKITTIGALAHASARLKVAMLVLDRSVLLDTRGDLSNSHQVDPQLPLVETLDALGASGWGPTVWHFKWQMADGVPVIESNRFLFMLAGRDLLREELLAGEFDGSLPELARWANAHRKKPTPDVLMGGEIAPGQPRGRFTVASGMTVQQALVAFAKASGISPYVALLDLTSALSGEQVTHPHLWAGAYLMDLGEWLPEPAGGASTAETPSN
jgi:hypothetical protein